MSERILSRYTPPSIDTPIRYPRIDAPLRHSRRMPPILIPSYIGDADQVLNLLIHEGARGVAKDYSGLGNHGAFVANPVWTDEDIAGWGIELDGVTGQHINCGNAAILNFERTDPFSLETWYHTNAQTENMIFSKQQNAVPHRGYSLRIGAQRLDLYLIHNWATANYIRVTTPANSQLANNSYHIIVTYDGSSLAAGVTFYINGVLQVPAVIVDALTLTIQTALDLQIGIRVNTKLFDGAFLEVRVYANRVLTGLEATARFEATRHMYGM